MLIELTAYYQCVNLPCFQFAHAREHTYLTPFCMRRKDVQCKCEELP